MNRPLLPYEQASFAIWIGLFCHMNRPLLRTVIWLPRGDIEHKSKHTVHTIQYTLLLQVCLYSHYTVHTSDLTATRRHRAQTQTFVYLYIDTSTYHILWWHVSVCQPRYYWPTVLALLLTYISPPLMTCQRMPTTRQLLPIQTAKEAYSFSKRGLFI